MLERLPLNFTCPVVIYACNTLSVLNLYMPIIFLVFQQRVSYNPRRSSACHLAFGVTSNIIILDLVRCKSLGQVDSG